MTDGSRPKLLFSTRERDVCLPVNSLVDILHPGDLVIVNNSGTTDSRSIFCSRPHSREDPTACLAFDQKMVLALVSRGIHFLAITLHTLVRYREGEEYEVTEDTAFWLNAARRNGKRIIAVGTSVMRTLETVTCGGVTTSGAGVTRVLLDGVTPATSVQGSGQSHQNPCDTEKMGAMCVENFVSGAERGLVRGHEQREEEG